MLVPPAYIVATIVRRRPLRLRSFELPLPPVRIAIAQVADLRGRLGACRCGPLRAAAAAAAVVPAVPRHLPRRHPARHGQPRSRRRRRVRGADGAAPQAVPHLRTAPAGAGRLSRRLLPAAARGRADRAGGRRSSGSAAGTWLAPARSSDRLTEQLTPSVLAIFTFLSGVVLLFSGATPAAAGRLELLHACCRSA